MNDDVKKEIATFRFGVIADLVGHRKLTRGERQRILREKSRAEWEVPYSTKTRISRSTILHWLRTYEASGRRLESLYPDARSDKNSTRALDEETALALIKLKQEFRGATLPTVLREAKARGIVPPLFKVSQATIYRFFKRQGLAEEEGPAVDRRRFEAELPNDLWQSDAMHALKVLVGGKLRKTHLFAFLDDMSRFIPHAEFYLRERMDSYTDCLRKALAKRGLPRKLYVDNGPTFSSRHLGQITAALGIALVHSTPYQPEGRGKIERWFKTVREQFLASMSEGLPLEVLNRYLAEWIDTAYHPRVHSSTGEAPMVRYLRHVHLLREAPRDLDDYFRKSTLRRVYKDRSVALNGRLYEAPVELIGKQVTLLYHDHDPARVEIRFRGAPAGWLTPLDLRVNGRVRRGHYLEIDAPKDPPSYPGGRLFSSGDPDDEL
jgi:putative transposase